MNKKRIVKMMMMIKMVMMVMVNLIMMNTLFTIYEVRMLDISNGEGRISA